MKYIVHKFRRKIMSLLTIISPSLNIRSVYFLSFKRRLNLKNPKTLDEKIQWLKLNMYNDNPLVIKCADKYRVREYVIDCGFPELLNELIGVYDKPEEIDWSKLPKQFALKSNYASGYNLICTDRNKLDISEAIKTLKTWGKSKKHLVKAELHYSKFKRKILCEKFISGKTKNQQPDDYKIYCFNGAPKYIMLCVGRGESKPKFYFFDANLKLARINKDSINASKNIEVENPVLVKKMFDYAKKLAEPFPFVRVDFYMSENKPIFGELTFTPAGGFDTDRLPKTDLLFGSMLTLPKIN